jgi:hypothetical protein
LRQIWPGENFAGTAGGDQARIGCLIRLAVLRRRTIAGVECFRCQVLSPAGRGGHLGRLGRMRSRLSQAGISRSLGEASRMIRRTPTLRGAGPVRVFARAPASLTIRTVAVEGKLPHFRQHCGSPEVTARIVGRVFGDKALTRGSVSKMRCYTGFLRIKARPEARMIFAGGLCLSPLWRYCSVPTGVIG